MRAKAYLDTSALIAFLDRSDSYHALFVRLFADPPALVTSPLVIAEAHGWFLRRYDAHRGLQLTAFVEELTPLEIATIGAPEIRKANAWLRRFSDQRLTIADAVGLELMRQRRLRACWSTDRHLALSGVPLVIHEPGE